MNFTTNSIRNSASLEQSVLYGDIYFKVIPKHTSAFNSLSIRNVSDWFESVTFHYTCMNADQRKNFECFVTALHRQLQNIDPEKVDVKVDEITEESSLLLWRESTNGISKLIFNEFGGISYVYIGKDGKKKRGLFDTAIDFEKLLYLFMSM